MKEPSFRQDEDFRVVIYRPNAKVGTHPNARKSIPGPSQEPSQELSQGPVEKILHLCWEPEKLAVLCETMGVSTRTKFREKYIAPLLRDEYLEMTNPENPTSQNQRYRLTSRGVLLLRKYDEEQNSH